MARAPVLTRLRSGAAFWKHGVPLLTGGAWPGHAGRVPSGASTALPNSGPCEPSSAGLHRVRAARRRGAQVAAVAVEVLAGAGDPHRRLEQLLIHGHAAGQRRVLDHRVPRRDQVVGHAARERVALRHERGARVDRARGRLHRRRQVGHESAELARLEQRRGLGEPRQRLADRRIELLDPRQDLLRERLRRAERGVERGQRAVGRAQQRRQRRDRGAEVVLAGGERAQRRVERGDEARELALARGERPEHLLVALHGRRSGRAAGSRAAPG